MTFEPIRVEGLAELQAALRGFPGRVSREFNRELRRVAEPVRLSIEARMASNISHMKPGSRWISARVGVSKNEVYIVPKQRKNSGPKSARPNFSVLAMQRAYLPAEAEVAPGLEKAAEAAVEKAAREVSS